MQEFKQPIALRWADLDPNFHVRHSVYYDFGAKSRMDFLAELGITSAHFANDHYGPILFREECVFRREIKYGDTIFISTKISKLRKDYARFSFEHEITKEDGTLYAVLTVDGAWMDTVLRKLITPPPYLIEVLEKSPRSASFEWMELKA